MWGPEIRKKAAGKRHFSTSQLNVAMQFFVCSGAFGTSDLCTVKRANVAV